MGVVVWAVLAGVRAAVEQTTLAGQVAAVVAPVTAGVIAYFTLGTWLRLPELDFVKEAVRTRVGRRTS
jgi:hypothetical protein